MEHEEQVPETDPEILRDQLVEREAALADALAANQVAAVRLREALLATEPSIDPALVTGESVADVEASFAAASTLVARVRERLREEQAARIPAGSPGRGSSASAMTAFEKIRAGLGKAG